ncbi:MAG TPA: NAD(P)/FAD-dependent oxidoreductase [Candidatus Omnitrophota bacterium]|nr:NAD(P)/FAD-dependent oxidoreductase [Candidatus Omnitrophota bacterium]HRZ14406.1 NAD(P)/FAD-dependent oxidoreductase [Candidatus Omnitrophota bacterium]
MYDIVVIGGGAVGTAVARELSRYKLRIALLEKEEELAFGVSKSNSGIIHPGTQNAPHSLKGRLCVQGNQLVRSISRELGVDFKEVGELIVAFTLEDIARLKQIQLDAQALGVGGLQLVDRSWLWENEPNLSHKIIAALYAPTAGIISPYRWTYDLSENARRNGVEIFTRTRVDRITRAGDHFEISAAGQTYACRYLVNCAGLFADEIAAMLGIRDFTIKPRKGEEFLLDKKRQNLTNHLIFPLPSPASKGTLVIITSDGNPMIGPTAEDTDDKSDVSTSEAGLRKVITSVKRLVPAIDERDIIAYFAGARPVAGDDFIIRHEYAAAGCITVAGIQSPGLTASPAIALYVVELLRKHGLVLRRKLFFHRYRKKTVHLFSAGFDRAQRLIRKDPSYGDIVCRCEMVSAKEIREAIQRGARTLDGIKFRTRCQAGRCHGSFCTSRVMKILAEETRAPLTAISKRGPGSALVVGDRAQEPPGGAAQEGGQP